MSGTIASDGAGAALYGTLKPVAASNPFGPLANIVGLAQGLGQAQNTLMQARSNAMQLQARQAMGPILQAAVDPQTGQLDYNKAMLGMAANPATAWMAPQFLNQAVARQQTQADTALKQLDFAQKQYTAYGNAAASLVSLGNSVTRGDVLAKLGDLAGAGLLSRDKALEFASRLPPDGAPLAAFVKQLGLQAVGAKDSMKGVIEQIQLGNQVHVVSANPYTGQATELGRGTVGATPAEANKPVTRVNTTPGPNFGQEIQTPRGATPGLPMVTPVGGQNGLQLGGGAAGLGAAPPAGTPAGGSNPLPVATPAVPPSPNAAPAPTAKPAAPFVTSLSPAQKEFQAGQGKTMASYIDNLNTSASHGINATQGLQQLLEAAQQIKTGAGTPSYAAVAHLASAMGFAPSVVNQLLGANQGDALAAYQEVMKYAAATALQSVKSVIGDSAPRVAEFEQMLKNFPSAGMQPKAIADMVRFMQAQVDMKLDEQKAFAQAKDLPGFDFSKWPAQWNQAVIHSQKYGWMFPKSSKK